MHHPRTPMKTSAQTFRDSRCVLGGRETPAVGGRGVGVRHEQHKHLGWGNHEQELDGASIGSSDIGTVSALGLTGVHPLLHVLSG